MTGLSGWKGLSGLAFGCGLLLMGMAFFASASVRADDEPRGAPQLPSATQVPAIKRLPNGQIVPVGPSDAELRTGALPRAAAPTKPPRVATPHPRVPVPPVSAAAIVVPAKEPPRATVTRIAGCPPDAITCVRVIGGDQAVRFQPLTFGQPFRAGDVPAQAVLVARDNKGNELPLQRDETVSRSDGSLRFAVLSALVPALAAHEARTVSIRLGNNATSIPAIPPAKATEKFDLAIELSIFSRQTTIVKFGNREGNKPGIPFLAGETITLKVGDERFGLTLTPQMAGGTLNTYMRIPQAFVSVINTQSKRFRARWTTANDSYERLWITSVARDDPFPVTVDYGGRASISVLQYTPYERPEVWVASLDGTTGGKLWLNGPVATERDILLPFVSKSSGKTHPQLSARIHLRHYPEADAYRADVVLGNDWAYEPGPQNYTYDIAIRRNGEVVYSHDDVTHTHHARWHELVWSKDVGEPQVIHDIPYLLESGVIPHYDPDLKVADRAVEKDFQALQKADTGPLGTALVTTYMPMTGGRPDIGPLPRWAVLYLLTMDPRERAVLFANADAGAGIPVHYRDRKTDLPVSLDDHSTMVMTNGRANRQDAFPPVTVGDNPWAPQIPHHPSLFYVPYLLTGDLFYLEEETFWANWVMASVDPSYRGGALGLIKPNEVRGQAWSLRTLGETALILPDHHPMKAYFTEKLRNNIDWYVAHYPDNPDPEQSPVIGVIPKPDDRGIMAPWQQDFLFMVVGQLAEQKVPGADVFLRWLARFTIGRWTSDATGFCHQMAPAYYIKIRKPDMTYARTLKEVFALNWPSETKGCPAVASYGNQANPGGYVANGHAALAFGADFGIPGAAEAFTRLRSEAPGMVQGFSDDPTFDIVPFRTARSFPDGAIK